MSENESHGHSRAAWIAVGIILTGCAIASVAVLFPNIWLGVAGGVVIILGAVAGKVMSMAGYGSSGHHSQAGGAFADAPDEVGAETRGKS